MRQRLTGTLVGLLLATGAPVPSTQDVTLAEKERALQNVKRRLFVAEKEDGEDVIGMLEAYKQAFSDEIKVFQLRRRMCY